MKKLISLVIALTMLLSCMVVSISAEGTEYSEISLLDKMTVVDGAVKVNEKNSQSSQIQDGVLQFAGPGSSIMTGDQWTRALLKLNEGVKSAGYKYIFMDVTFSDNVRASGNNAPTCSIGYTSSANGTPDTFTSTIVTTSDALNATKSVSLDFNALAGKSITLVVILPEEAPAEYINYIYLYPVTWNGISAGDILVTSMRMVSDPSVIENVGVQGQMDYGKTYTVSPSNASAGKYNSETISATTFDGRSAWKYSYVSGGASYGSFYLGTDFNVGDYNYVTYDIYVVDAALTACTPMVNADTGSATGRLDDAASSYPIKTGEWQTVTLKLDTSKTGKVSRIQMFPFGSYMSAVFSGCSQYYMSAITFHEKLPVESSAMQPVKMVRTDNATLTDWGNSTVTNNVEFANSNGITLKTFKSSNKNYVGNVVLAASNVDASQYKYVSFSFYIKDVNGDYKSDATFAPTVNGFGKPDAAKTWEAGVWHSVVVEYDCPSAQNFGIWVLGSYANAAGVGTPDVYVSSITFSADDPRATASNDATQSIRFVSVLKDSDLTKYSAVGYKVVVNGVEQTVESNTVYTSVIGAGNEYTPESEGGKYFSVVRVDGVPTGSDIKFTVIAYVVTVDGNTIESLPATYTVQANGAIG